MRGPSEALAAPPPHLTAAVAAEETGLERGVDALGQRRGDLTGRIETTLAQPPPRGRYRDHGAAQQVGRRQPADPLGDQLGNWQQAAELERRDETASDVLVRRRGPGAIESRWALAKQRLSRRQAASATIAEGCLVAAGTAASGAKRWRQTGDDGVQELHVPSLPGKGARVARRSSGLCQGFVPEG